MSDNILHPIECDCQQYLNKWEKVRLMDEGIRLINDGFKPENESDDLDIYCKKCGGCGESGCCKVCENCMTFTMFELHERIEFLEEELDKLTDVVKAMSDYLRKDIENG